MVEWKHVPGRFCVKWPPDPQDIPWAFVQFLLEESPIVIVPEVLGVAGSFGIGYYKNRIRLALEWVTADSSGNQISFVAVADFGMQGADPSRVSLHDVREESRHVGYTGIVAEDRSSDRIVVGYYRNNFPLGGQQVYLEELKNTDWMMIDPWSFYSLQ